MKILALKIRNFRGIVNLELKPDGHTVVLCGANGTGKSSVVEAIDFLLTGSIRRFEGKGAGDLSLTEHAPHLGAPVASAAVEAKVRLPSCAEFTIVRTVARRKTPTISPASSAELEAALEVAAKGHHALTRQQILRFIAVTPGDRAQTIQALLDVESILKLGKQFAAAARDAKSALASAAEHVEAIESQLADAVGVDGFDEGEISERLSTELERLGLSPLAKGSLKLPRAIPSPGPASTPSSMGEDLLALVEELERSRKTAAPAEQSMSTALKTLAADPGLLEALEEQELVAKGLSRLAADDSACPLCKTEWDGGELRKFLQQRVRQAERAATLQAALDAQAAQVSRAASELASEAERLARQLDHADAKRFLVSLAKGARAAGRLLKNPSALTDEAGWRPSRWLPADVEVLRKAAAALPAQRPPTAKEEAARILTECRVLCTQLGGARARRAQEEKRAAAAQALKEAAQGAKNRVLSSLYDQIQDTFSSLYAKLHAHEKGFCAELRQEENSLRFEVDFHGRGLFPPTALHSEGHQDSMGLCLYLALMKKLTQGQLQVTVLDDVMMSVDSEHRREICTLLHKDFEGQQFFITTHDRLWAKQLQHEGVVAAQNLKMLGGWSLEDGPVVSATGWEKVDELLARGEVDQAAFALRRQIEEFFSDVCDALHAPVRFRGHGRYDSADLYPGARDRFRELLAKASEAAASWRSEDRTHAIEKRLARLNDAVRSLEQERWIINLLVHHNADYQATAADLRPVTKALRQLFEEYKCGTCHSAIAIRSSGGAEVLTCVCAEVSWPLQKHKVKAAG